MQNALSVKRDLRDEEPRVLGWVSRSQARMRRGQDRVKATRMLIEGKQVAGHARCAFTSYPPA